MTTIDLEKIIKHYELVKDLQIDDLEKKQKLEIALAQLKAVLEEREKSECDIL
jgi:hypothetical protein